ncbi:ribosome biogenesis protein-like protein RPF2 [Dothidotthia symphoricarpi CBS 119687]|uniref:Ribosome production factor 2 homolog n=1 Tax=Dothidotthia symphoricarpi CBS 119687 TaxID=1392245 RepID=A0A6A6ANA2_9PLEO|nr:ribosome biogenesis protein-like protein RPF2 [Dothidotthia symphoricarpi CBS 119687]KAF2133016.1 ribosome biogenesis protein-like protein RPF2 [Dothidotthia symphoricarpi CBS 119687]
MLKTVKPKNARAKRAMEKREPQQTENPKTTLFVTGQRTSQILKLAIADLSTLKRPFVEKFTKKNDIHPFDDASSFEFFSLKNDTSLIAFSLHSKKRPHCLTLARTFSHKMLDMLELYINPDTFRNLQQFKNKKPSIGLKPLVAFHGTVFEDPNQTKYTLAKSLLLDMLRGQDTDEVDVEGLQYLISISAQEPTDAIPTPEIKLRCYLLRTKRSGQKLPRIEVEEMGPRIDFRLGREQFPDPDVLKEALKKPRGMETRTKKNIDTDNMGDKTGRIHVGKQDLGNMQTRKMKGLKRARGERDDEEVGVEDVEGDNEATLKKIKV